MASWCTEVTVSLRHILIVGESQYISITVLQRHQVRERRCQSVTSSPWKGDEVFTRNGVTCPLWKGVTVSSRHIVTV